MARRAVRDTYGLERTGIGSPDVRRLVKAGQLVPDGIYVLEDEGAAVEDRRTTNAYRLHAKAAGREDVQVGSNRVARARPRVAPPDSDVAESEPKRGGRGPKGPSGP